MEKAVPVLQIDDYEEAKSFYVDKLGFEIDFEQRHEPGFPVFMGIKKGDIYLMLSEHGKDHTGTEVYVFVEDVKAWHEVCLKGDVNIGDGLVERMWGNTELPITDPHRNLLRITQTDTHKSTV